jgi:DNA-directed RNA polymerase specialized sigma24 family protein
MVVSNEEYEEALDNPDNKAIMNLAGANFVNVLGKDEVHSCKLMALWKTLQTWNPDKSKFTSLLHRMVRWECLRSVKNARDPPIPTPFLPATTPSDTPIWELIDGLSDESKDIIIKRFVGNMTLDEISEEYDCCYETIRLKIAKALSQLKESFLS